MKKIIYFAVFITAFLVIPTFKVQAKSFYCFTKQIKIGSIGGDVKILQKILNQDPDTIVASSGHGSMGKETAYFGSLTSNALTRFQDKYKTPSISGSLDLDTLLKINTVSGWCVPPNQTIPTANATSTASTTPQVNILPGVSGARILSAYPKVSNIGGIITLTGEFATTGNNINFGKYRVASNVSSENDTLKFMIPVDSKENCSTNYTCGSFLSKIFEPGSYDVSVTNSNGKSNTTSIEIPDNSDVLTIYDPDQYGTSWFYKWNVPPWNIKWHVKNSINISTTTFDISIFKEESGCIIDPCPVYSIPITKKIRTGHTGSTYLEWVEGKTQAPPIIDYGVYRIQVCIQNTNICDLSSPICIKFSA